MEKLKQNYTLKKIALGDSHLPFFIPFVPLFNACVSVYQVWEAGFGVGEIPLMIRNRGPHKVHWI